MKSQITYRFTVQGVQSFPLDMLRYDGCYPATPEGVEAIAASLSNDSRYEDGHRKIYKVKLLSNLPPTEGRWASFSWYVIETETIRR
jgi:hypothetical protein